MHQVYDHYRYIQSITHADDCHVLTPINQCPYKDDSSYLFPIHVPRVIMFYNPL